MTKRLKSILKISAVLGVLMLFCAGCGEAPETAEAEAPANTEINENCIDDIISKGKLTVGCKTDVPGLSCYDELTGEWSGIEVELAYEIAGEIFGVSAEEAKEEGLVELVGVTVADREEMLESGEIDLMLATYTITDERSKRFALSESYYSDYIGLMVRTSGENPNSLGSSEIATITDLDGKYIGVARNSTTREVFLSVLSVSPIFCEYDSYGALFTALKNGDIDVMAVDISILNGYVDSATKILGVKFGRQDYGAAVTNENAPLIEEVNKAIADYLSQE